MSTLRVNTIQGLDAVERYLARAWVNFNGTGTPAIRAAGNVSSITDNGTGDYTVNFTVALADANYSALTTVAIGTAMPTSYVGSLLAGSCRVFALQKSAAGSIDSTAYDPATVNFAAFR